jgi:hypothetical protein
MIHNEGWYYLPLTTVLLAGAASSYNIRMGRARAVTGPFVDNMGIDMLRGGGKLFVGSGGRYIGPGHFGLLDLGDGVQKFSLHFEADLDRGGRSVLDIRPLLWRMAGPWRERTSRRARTRSSRPVPGRRWRWPSRACRSAGPVLAADPAPLVAAPSLLPASHPRRRRM